MLPHVSGHMKPFVFYIFGHVSPIKIIFPLINMYNHGIQPHKPCENELTSILQFEHWYCEEIIISHHFRPISFIYVLL